MTHGKKIQAPMLLAVRKKAADGEERLLMRFQLAWISADMSMRMMAKFDNSATSSGYLSGLSTWQSLRKIPAPWKGMVRYVDGD